MEAGLQVKRCEELGSTTVVEYDRADGCYAYFDSVDGCYRLSGTFEEVLANWACPWIKLRLDPVEEIRVRETATVLGEA